MKKPEKIAWKLLRELLKDDEQYFSLRNKVGPVELVGESKTRYFLYPNGQLARLDASEAKIGHLHPPKDIPLPDFMATLVIWIRYREAELLKRWRCGNLTFSYDDSKEDEQVYYNYVNNAQTFEELQGAGTWATCYGPTGYIFGT